MMKSSDARVTIGVPVFNGEAFVGRAIESARRQTFPEFRLIVSDNVSSDGTRQICEEFARSDPRITYVRQDRNVGAFDNFRSIVEGADSEFFVYLAADDYWEPEFLELAILKLDEEKHAIAAISMVDFVDHGLFHHHSYGDQSIDGSVTRRLRKYLAVPTDNSRFYSVFRTRVLSSAIRAAPNVHALDWYIMALTLLQGSQLRIDRVLMSREIGANPGKYADAAATQKNGTVAGRYFPVFPMTLALLKQLPLGQSVLLFWTLVSLNWTMHKQQIAHSYPDSLYANVLRNL